MQTTLGKDPLGRFVCSAEILGRGASKVVYRGFDREEGCEVAWCKVPSQSLGFGVTSRAHREVQILMGLEHPRIVRLIKSWVDPLTSDLVLITDLYYSPLDEYVRKHGKQQIHVIRKWALQIIDALSYLHSRERPIAHRDIKCANIFVDNYRGGVALGDLGFASVLSESRTSNSVLGTAEFMSPECLQGKYTHKSDVYAFGMSLLEMSTLKKPYSRFQTVSQLYMQILNELPPEELLFVKCSSLKDLIVECIKPEAERPSIQDLLRFEFFTSTENDFETVDDVITAPRNFGFFRAPIERYCLTGSSDDSF